MSNGIRCVGNKRKLLICTQCSYVGFTDFFFLCDNSFLRFFCMHLFEYCHPFDCNCACEGGGGGGVIFARDGGSSS